MDVESSLSIASIVGTAVLLLVLCPVMKDNLVEDLSCDDCDIDDTIGVGKPLVIDNEMTMSKRIGFIRNEEK